MSNVLVHQTLLYRKHILVSITTVPVYYTHTHTHTNAHTPNQELHTCTHIYQDFTKTTHYYILFYKFNNS